MITEWFLSLVAGFVGMLADAFGEWDAPPELTSASGGVNDVIGSFQGMGVWVNWPVLSACIAASLAVWSAVVGIKLVRAIAAHIPQFGGAGD